MIPSDNTHFIAKTLHGLEEVLADELREIGAKNIKILKRAVSFSGNKKILYRANLESRTAMRILVPIQTFRVRHESALYEKVKKTDWSQFMSLKDTLAIDGVTHSDYFNHSQYIALKTKDAIVDQFREKTGRRPNVDTQAPTLRINVHINDDQCIISLDSSGDALYKRGYRTETLEAPINEILAAGMILLSGWKKDSNFIDAMCGSGTLLIEAYLLAHNIPPQYKRASFGFQNWKDYDPKLWKEVVENAEMKKVDFPYKILGYDKDLKAVRTAENNLISAGLEGKIEIHRKKFEMLEPPVEKGLLMMNPPYDERIQSDDIIAFYGMIGERLKHAFTGYEAWLISSNMKALKNIGLRPSRKITLFNGSLECKFLKYELYAGSKKAKHQKAE